MPKHPGKLTPRERLKASLADDPALDRPPVALWRHFPVDDQSPDTLAAATLDFQQHYGFDLVKVTPASSFCLKDWGVQDAWEGHTEGTRHYTRHIINEAGDWERLPRLDPLRSPHLAAQLDCLKRIRAALPPEIPILQTVFSPLAQAKHLVDGDNLLAHLHRHPEALRKGLETIALVTRRFVEAALATGIDGIFYAIQHARQGALTLEEYRTFGLPVDRQVLEPAASAWCNLLHLHGERLYFDILDDLAPAFQIVNWHDRETPPSLKDALLRFPGIVCGGVSQKTIVYADREAVRAEARDALEQTRGRRFMLGTGCVVPVIAPHGNIQAVVDAVHPEREA